MRTLPRTFTPCLIAASLVLGVSVFSPSTAHAACAISVGEGEGPTQQIAERRAQRDARQKAGGVRPSNANFSEPMCYVADDFANGIATYGCQVEYSYCTDPVLPVEKASKPGSKGPFWKLHQRHKHWKRHHAGRGHGGIEFGGWRKSETVVSCLRFNAKASARTADHASDKVNAALIGSIAANVGTGFRHRNVEITDPYCTNISAQKVTCRQTARYCF